MSDNTEKKKSEVSEIPYVTAVEIANKRRAGIGGSKATMYNCNFAKNDYERNKARRKRLWQDFWKASRGKFFLFYFLALITIPYLIAGSYYSPEWKTFSIITIIFFSVILFVIIPVVFFWKKKKK